MGFIPNDIQCFWCGGHMKRGTCFSSFTINHVTYFCEDCGAVSHFAVNHERTISSVEVMYKTNSEKPDKVHGGTTIQLDPKRKKSSGGVVGILPGQMSIDDFLGGVKVGSSEG